MKRRHVVACIKSDHLDTKVLNTDTSSVLGPMKP